MSIYISNPKPICFLKLPKNAGRSIQKWLELYNDEYVFVSGKYAQSYKQLKSYLNLTDCFSFSVVRNPWDRVSSVYYYLKEIKFGNLNNRKIYNMLEWFTEDVTFENFVENLHFNKIYHNSTNQCILTQGVTKILKYEDINENFKQIQEYLNFYEPLPIINVTPNRKKDYHLDYNNKTINIIKNLFLEDIEKYNYSFYDDDPWINLDRSKFKE